MTEKIRVPVTADSDIVKARMEGRAMATQLGFSLVEATFIATTISEVARNIIEYAKEGEIILATLNQGGRRGLLITASDRGPGINDVAQAMQDGYSTRNSLGMGLPGAKRLMDEFEIVSVAGQGTTVIMKKWMR